MAFCSKCGKELTDGVKFCPACGAPVTAAQKQPDAQSTPNGFEETFNEINDTADTTDQFDENDIRNNKLMAILAYFGLLCLIPLFAAKESRFARFHTNQGLVLLIVGAVYSIAYEALMWVFSRLVLLKLIYWLLRFVLAIPTLAIVVLAVIGIVNAAGGRAKELPIIGKYRILG